MHVKGVLGLACLLAAFCLLVFCGAPAVVKALGRISRSGLSAEAIAQLPSYRHGGPKSKEVCVLFFRVLDGQCEGGDMGAAHA